MIFSRAGYEQLDEWFGAQADLAIEVPLHAVQPGGIGAIAYLRGVPYERRRWYHANVMRARGRMHYSMHAQGGSGDATEWALRGVMRELRSWHRHGLRQQHAGGHWNPSRLCLDRPPSTSLELEPYRLRFQVTKG